MNNKYILFSTYKSKFLIFNSKINHLFLIFKGDFLSLNNEINNNYNKKIFLIHYSTKYCEANYLNENFTKLKFYSNIFF